MTSYVNIAQYTGLLSSSVWKSLLKNLWSSGHLLYKKCLYGFSQRMIDRWELSITQKRCFCFCSALGHIYKGKNRVTSDKQIVCQNRDGLSCQYGNQDVIDVIADLIDNYLMFKINGEFLRDKTNQNPFRIELDHEQKDYSWFPAISIVNTKVTGHLDFQQNKL